MFYLFGLPVVYSFERQLLTNYGISFDNYAKKLIGLEDLPDNIGVKLEDGFKKEIFDRAIFVAGGVRKLSRLLGCDRTAIWQWKTGKILTKVGLLKKLSSLISLRMEEVENRIVGIRCKRTENRDFIKIKFPIVASPELASVVGHAMADGNVSNRQFSFFNQSRELIDKVINNVNVAFGTDLIPREFEKSNGWEIEFPTNISLLISLCGAPLGNKVFTPFDVYSKKTEID